MRRFLRQVLFGENSINLKTEAVEKRREQVQKMPEQIEREARENAQRNRMTCMGVTRTDRVV